MNRLRFGILLLVFALAPARAGAEWQFKPFAGLTFGGSTTFIDLDDAAGDPKLNVGAGVTWLGEVLGLESDIGRTSGFFQRDGGLILTSHVTTLTGNVILALPRRMAQYTLRPYVVGGAGLMHVGWQDNLNALPVSDALAAYDIGGGVTGFLSERVGLNWDLRYFGTLRSEPESGVSVGPERLSFWRATMGLTFRL